ncbi:MAG: ABC transporter permease [Terracidiphilus sp.]
MTTFSFLRFMSRLRWLFGQGQANREFGDEIETHIELLKDRLMRQGMSREDAASAALRQFGNTVLIEQRHREARSFLWFTTVLQDVRYGLRMLRRSPGFTAIVAASLALAIGANTAIFSVAKNLLYDRLGVSHPEQLRLLGWAGDDKVAVHSYWSSYEALDAGMKSECFSYPVFRELQAHNRSLEGLFAFKDLPTSASVRGSAQRMQVELVSGNFYSDLGVRPQLGRAIQPADDVASGAGAVAVISDALWRREFGRSPAVLGQMITVDQSVLTIVGVNPRSFTGAQSVQQSPDLFVPLSMQPLVKPWGHRVSLLSQPDNWWLEVMGRVKPNVTDRQLRSELDVELAAVVHGTMTVKPDETIPRMVLADGSRGLHQLDGSFKGPVNVLMVLVGLVLALACANVANLLLARGAQRQREMSVRLALGAARARILRQLLTESLLLAALGGTGGLLLGYLGRNEIPRLLTTPWLLAKIDIPFDWGVSGFAAGVTLLTGILFGMAPAWSAARREVSSSLKEGAQTATRRRKGAGGKMLVGFQIALSTLLVIGAGLFLRTVLGLSETDAGFRTEHLLLAYIDPPRQRYPEGKDVFLHQQLEQAIAAVPGVQAVTLMSTPYLTDSMSKMSFMTEAESADPAKAHGERDEEVGNRFFETLGIPILAGRGFGPQDTASSAKVAVINQSLARTRFPHGNPIGQRFRLEGNTGDWIRVVGICADTRYQNLREDNPPQFFVPYVQQTEVGGMSYVIRTKIAPEAIVPALRRTVAQIDSNLPLEDVRTQQEQIDESMRKERALAALIAGFGLLALALAAVGIYGVMAYSVANRRNEIGIRLALGAQPAQVRGIILRESAWLAVAGIVVGVGAALPLTRLVKSMLYGIQPYDPTTITAGILVLLAVTLAASWIPARRAAGVQPMEALRYE